MVNPFTASIVRAEDSPIHDMDFLLFLADSIINNDELTTPLDLQAIDIQEVDPDQAQTHQEEASND